MHSEAVSLEIPIKVHGSRVTEVVLGTTPHTEPFEEQSTTMIVFAQGGVLKMSTPVTSGQMMVLTNLKTRQDVICRVLKVRNNPNLQSYVEIEFTHPQPGYWGVFFPSDDSEQASRPAASVQPVNSEPRIKAETGPESSRPFAGPPNMPSAMPARPPRRSLYRQVRRRRIRHLLPMSHHRRSLGQRSFLSGRRKKYRSRLRQLCQKMRGCLKSLKKIAERARRRRIPPRRQIFRLHHPSQLLRELPSQS